MSRFNHPSAPNTGPEQTPEQLNRSTTAGGISWKKALAVGGVPLVLLFSAAFQSSNSVPGQLQAIQAKLGSLEAKIDSLASKGPRKFYLTKTDTHNGSQALSACAEGYHMASLREIHDTSNLRYDTDLGQTLTDSGFGPPNTYGWIRTGELANSSAFPGIANCNAWTSANVGDDGTRAAPNRSWDIPGTDLSPWISSVDNCAANRPVWCVQD